MPVGPLGPPRLPHSSYRTSWSSVHVVVSRAWTANPPRPDHPLTGRRIPSLKRPPRECRPHRARAERLRPFTTPCLGGTMSSRIITVEPFDLVVFGGAGDLAYRKLLPALFERHRDGQIPPIARIIGVSRRPMQDREYRAATKAA